MTTLMTLALIHPHPLFRGMIFLFMVGGLIMLFAVLAILRYQRHAEMTSRLKTLEEKLDRLGNPPAAK
jgi:hypothetical protein